VRLRPIAALLVTAACSPAAQNEPVRITPPASSAAPSQAEVLGKIDGKPVRRADLELETQRKLLEQQNESEQRKLHSLWLAFEDEISRRLFEKEATRRGVTVAELRAEEIDKKVPAPTDDEVRAIYDANAADIGVPFEIALEPIRKQMHQQAREESERAFAEKLREGVNIEYALPIPPLPRFEVADGGGFAAGPPTAKVTVVEFSDFQCPYCAQGRRVVDDLKRLYPNEIRVVFRDFPLSQHTRARPAAYAAFCAGEQGKFWPYHDKLFDNQQALSESDLTRYAQEVGLTMDQYQSCLASERPAKAVDAHEAAGRALGVQGTPSIFINGIKLIGLLPLPVMQSLVDHEIGRAR
jgi:protein-disulfide isomerase